MVILYFRWKWINFGIFQFKFHLYWQTFFDYLPSKLLLFWNLVEQSLTFFGGFSQHWKIDFSWWFWSLGKKIGQKNETFFKKFDEKIVKKLIIFQVIDFHNLNEIIKFRRKSWCLSNPRHWDWSNFLQMWDTDFREGLKFVIWKPSVNFYTCKISKSKSS